MFQKFTSSQVLSNEPLIQPHHNTYTNIRLSRQWTFNTIPFYIVTYIPNALVQYLFTKSLYHFFFFPHSLTRTHTQGNHIILGQPNTSSRRSPTNTTDWLTDWVTGWLVSGMLSHGDRGMEIEKEPVPAPPFPVSPLLAPPPHPPLIQAFFYMYTTRTACKFWPLPPFPSAGRDCGVYGCVCVAAFSV